MHIREAVILSSFLIICKKSNKHVQQTPPQRVKIVKKRIWQNNEALFFIGLQWINIFITNGDIILPCYDLLSSFIVFFEEVPVFLFFCNHKMLQIAIPILFNRSICRVINGTSIFSFIGLEHLIYITHMLAS